MYLKKMSRRQNCVFVDGRVSDVFTNFYGFTAWKMAPLLVKQKLC